MRRRLPVFPVKRYLDWAPDEPADKSIEEMRRIRDDLEHRVRNLFAEMAITAPG